VAFDPSPRPIVCDIDPSRCCGNTFIVVVSVALENAWMYCLAASIGHWYTAKSRALSTPPPPHSDSGSLEDSVVQYLSWKLTFYRANTSVLCRPWSPTFDLFVSRINYQLHALLSTGSRRNSVKVLFFLMLLHVRKSTALFECSHVSPSRPSDKDSINPLR
jgi:hypothetical protein